jgi:hypothetical protein
MRWLARIDSTRALSIAALWPAILLVIHVLLMRILPLWVMRREDVIYAEVEMTPGAWPRLAALLIVPPLGFLIAWIVARRRFRPDVA